jgi:hypothetical protein
MARMQEDLDKLNTYMKLLLNAQSLQAKEVAGPLAIPVVTPVHAETPAGEDTTIPPETSITQVIPVLTGAADNPTPCQRTAIRLLGPIPEAPRITEMDDHDESTRLCFEMQFSWNTCNTLLNDVVAQRRTGARTCCLDLNPIYDRALSKKEKADIRVLFAGEARHVAGTITGKPPILGKLVEHECCMCNTVHTALPIRMVDASYRGGGGGGGGHRHTKKKK